MEAGGGGGGGYGGVECFFECVTCLASFLCSYSSPKLRLSKPATHLLNWKITKMTVLTSLHLSLDETHLDLDGGAEIFHGGDAGNLEGDPAPHQVRHPAHGNRVGCDESP
jgi:hypothetical protein